MTDGYDDDRLFQAKKRLVEIKHVELSKDQPYKVFIKRNGVFLTGCKTRMGVDVFLHQVSIEVLRGGKVTRGKQGNARDRR